MIKNATAKIKNAKRIFNRAGETPTVNCVSKRASMNCVSNFCRERNANQKNKASAGGKTSNSHNKFGCSNRIIKIR